MNQLKSPLLCSALREQSADSPCFKSTTGSHITAISSVQQTLLPLEYTCVSCYPQRFGAVMKPSSCLRKIALQLLALGNGYRATFR